MFIVFVMAVAAIAVVPIFICLLDLVMALVEGVVMVLSPRTGVLRPRAGATEQPHEPKAGGIPPEMVNKRIATLPVAAAAG